MGPLSSARSALSLLSAACVSLALLASVLAAPAQAANVAGGAPAAPGGVALTWTPAYMSDSHDYTSAEATALARTNDIVAGMPVAFDSHVTEMRAANAELVLLAYANATLAAPGNVSGLPESAFAHDTAGRRITAPSFGTYLMESSDARWRREANEQCDDRAARGGYDGCLVDMLTLGVFSKDYVTALPVNPATGSEYTQPQYKAQMTSLAAYYRTQSPGLAHVGNSVENSYRYWQSKLATSRSLANSQPGAQMEDFLRGAGTAVTKFPVVADWLRNIDVIRDMESQGTVGLFTTKLWVGPTAAQTAQWQAYTIASFLMGADGRSYLSFSTSRDKAGVLGTRLPYAMPKDIGTPQGAMVEKASGAWTRSFSNGLSVVNPTTATVTVNLGSPMRTLAGTTVSSITLAPSSGQALVRAAAPAVDETAPTVTLDSAAVDGATASLSGTLTDDVRAARVEYGVRDETSKKWLRSDGTWGSYQRRVAGVATSSSTSTTWSASLTLPAGRYGVSVVGVDGAGNLSTTRPWRVVEVGEAPAPDTTAPTVTLATPDVQGRTVTWSGVLSDEVRVQQVVFAVRDEATKKWLRPNGSWGSYVDHEATMTGTSATRRSWAASRTLPAGRYGISVTGYDAAGNASDSRPWRVVTVS